LWLCQTTSVPRTSWPDILVAKIHNIREPLCAGIDHADKGNSLSVYAYAVRGAFFDGYGILDHLSKADSLKERNDKSKASIGSHLSFGEGNFDFVYLRHCGRISVHSFVPPLVGVDCLVDN